MEPFITVTSHVCPLPIKDIDTDMIIPAQYLTSISRTGFGEHLFTRLKAADPSFPLNDPRYSDSSILLADSNFGCGSSREHAVWAILGGGFKVVIAKSFADIFKSNSTKNGLLLVTLPADAIDLLLARAATEKVFLTVDLERQIVSASVSEISKQKEPQEWSFAFPPFEKHCLLNGLDDLDYLCSQSSEIAKWKKKLEPYVFVDAAAPQTKTREEAQ